jgi:glucose-1-phosphate cytidylyltransferase
METPKVVILSGGEGTRLREETEFKPKPMVTIGGLPILWHIMKIYASYGFKEFVLCLGYKGDVIKQFFLTHELMHNDATIRLNDRMHDTIHRMASEADDWTITFADTGLKAMTGSRIKKIERYIGGDCFLATYGDAVSTISIPDTIKLHKKLGTIATLGAVHPHSKFGLIREGKGNLVESFVEKPVLEDYVNGGFYVFQADIFDRLSGGEECVLEAKPFEKLAADGKLGMYKHEGFWHAMDTYKDYLDLNRMWDEGKRPWKIWK